MKPHFKALEAAYQLRYYLWLKTHYLRPLINSEVASFARTVLDDVCVRNEYHLLDSDIADDQIRLHISLQPAHTVSQTIKMIKGNLNHQFGTTFGGGRLLGRGYFARTAGNIDLERARSYVDNQIVHHGYKGDWTKPMKFKNEEFKSPAFEFEHHMSILNYHLVFSTQYRIPLFDEKIAPELFRYLLSVGKKDSFAIERVGVLPDHMHMMIEGIPSISVQDYALAIINNTKYWMDKNYSGVLKETGAWDVWQPSYYAGSIGEYTSTQVSSFLLRRE
jgi:REP element-mobilizing transposase RayT